MSSLHLKGHNQRLGSATSSSQIPAGRGKEASDRLEKSIEIARKKAEADVSNPLALGVDRTPN
jgi:hypothetical protein